MEIDLKDIEVDSTEKSFSITCTFKKDPKEVNLFFN